jgi:hypothetical protein
MIISQHLFCDGFEWTAKTGYLQRNGFNQKHHMNSIDDLSGAMESLFLLYWVNRCKPQVPRL